MQQSNDGSVNNYFTRIYRGIARKKIILSQEASLEGCRLGEELVKDCSFKLQSIYKKINEEKIDAVIKKAESLIKEHLAHDPHAVVLMLLKLLKNIAEHTDVEITAHPKDAEIIRSSLSEIAMAHASARKVMLTEDRGLEQGSFLIKANKSIIDAHLKTQLDQAKDLLLSHLETHYGRAY